MRTCHFGFSAETRVLTPQRNAHQVLLRIANEGVTVSSCLGDNHDQKEVRKKGENGQFLLQHPVFWVDVS